MSATRWWSFAAKMDRPQLLWMFETAAAKSLGQRMQRRMVIIVERSILCGTTSARARMDPAWSPPVGQRSVWQLSDWMQAERDMKPAPNCTSRRRSHRARHVEAVAILTGGATRMRSRGVDADQRVCERN